MKNDKNTPAKRVKFALKHLIKWTEYAHKLVEIGLKNRQIHAVKIFITQEFKSISDWSKLVGIPQQTLSRWLNHDELFRQCLADASDVYMNVVIPFRIMSFAKKVAQGDIRALSLVLKLRGKLQSDRQEDARGRWEELTKEWM